MVKIRAKSVLKLDTGMSSLDYEYPKGASVDDVANDLLSAVAWNKGTDAAKEFLDELISKHPGVPPCGTSVDA